MKKPEILAPAGDFTCLQAAIDAGADAVYFGLGTFNMRARSGVNFKVEDLPEIARRCGADLEAPRRGGTSGTRVVKRYLTLNAIMFEGEVAEVEETIKAAVPYVDAFIVSDWGVISLVKKHGGVVHVSTQMSTSNSLAVKFLAAQGVERVVLARECALGEVKRISEAAGAPVAPRIAPPSELASLGGYEDGDGTVRGVELECFVHGAQCVAQSGRCFMSHSIFGKSACRGECTQPCRRRFLVKAVDLYENDQGAPVHEGKTEFLVEPHTVLSTKDLCSLGFVDKLIDAGIASFKIEGRARNAEYVKTTVECYRRAVDAVMNGTYTPALVAELTTEVKKVFHREFSDGMYFGRPGVDQFTDTEDSLSTTVKRHIGIVIDYYLKAQIAQVKIQDHAIAVGDTVQIHGPTTGVQETVITELHRDEERPTRAEKGTWVTFRAPRCRVGDKVFFVEQRNLGV